MESKASKYPCMICGMQATEEHHLVFGTANRVLCDADKLVIYLCRPCHNAIHYESAGITGERSKMMGQCLYELQQVIKHGANAETARNAFRKRYGKSYL